MTELRQREPRRRNPKYLAWLRRQACACGCGSAQPSDAAHIRASSLEHGKEITGRGEKPHDHWAVPLRHDHHMAQTKSPVGEVAWWAAHGKNPFSLARYYNRRYLEATGDAADRGRAAPVPKAKWPRKARPEPRQRAKIPKRKDPWPKGRKFQKAKEGLF